MKQYLYLLVAIALCASCKNDSDKVSEVVEIKTVSTTEHLQKDIDSLKAVIVKLQAAESESGYKLSFLRAELKDVRDSLRVFKQLAPMSKNKLMHEYIELLREANGMSGYIYQLHMNELHKRGRANMAVPPQYQ